MLVFPEFDKEIETSEIESEKVHLHSAMSLCLPAICVCQQYVKVAGFLHFLIKSNNT